MSKIFSVGLIQESSSADINANIDKTVSAIRSAAELGAEIICLQELFNTPYICTVEDESRFDYAEEIPGPLCERLQKLAAELEIVIVAPYFEKRTPGIYHNSAVVIDADGSLLGVYRKMHIPDDPLYYEKFYFTPGDSNEEESGFKVFETRYARIGVLICWDQWYPEAARITSLMGAEILFYPTAIGWHPREKDEFGQAQLQAWQTIQRSHSIANGVFLCSVNRVGHEETEGTDGIQFFGNSFISDPFGQTIAEASESEPEILVAKCDRSLIETTRRNWPFLRDRRVDAYKKISSRFID